MQLATYSLYDGKTWSEFKFPELKKRRLLRLLFLIRKLKRKRKQIRELLHIEILSVVIPCAAFHLTSYFRLRFSLLILSYQSIKMNFIKCRFCAFSLLQFLFCQTFISIGICAHMILRKFKSLGNEMKTYQTST